jgi:hypothetical protein
MAGSITYPDVVGADKHGDAITVRVGDLLTGYTQNGDLVSGRVVATHPHYPSATLYGVEMSSDGVTERRADVHLADVLTHIRPERSVYPR